MRKKRLLMEKPGKIARATALGFALGPMIAQPAQAYYALAIGLIAGTGLAITGGIVLTVHLITKDGTAVVDPDNPGALARRMIDTAVLSTEGDLALQIQLLIESPSAFDQFTHELGKGGGASVQALMQATNLSLDTLSEQWTAARDGRASARDEAEAREIVTQFLANISPHVSVSDEQAAAVAWELVRETLSPDFPGIATRHVWLSDWLGVTPDALTLLSGEVATSLADGEDDLRTRVYAEPDRFLDALATALEQNHEAELEAKVADLAEQYQMALQDQVAADSRPTVGSEKAVARR